MAKQTIRMVNQTLQIIDSPIPTVCLSVQNFYSSIQMAEQTIQIFYSTIQMVCLSIHTHPFEWLTKLFK